MTDDGGSAFDRAQKRGKHGRQQDDGVIVIRTIAMPADTKWILQPGIWPDEFLKGEAPQWLSKQCSFCVQ